MSTARTSPLVLQQGGLGKLPSQPEFIKVNSGSREVSTLDHWLQEGLYHLKRELGPHWEGHYDSRLHHRFAYRADNSGMTVLGVIRAAMDIHERRFPFVAYSLIPTRILDAQPLIIPNVYDALYEPLEQAIIEAADLEQLSDIRKRLDREQPFPAVSAGLEGRYAEFLDDVVCADLGWFPTSSVDLMLSDLLCTLSGAAVQPRRFSMGIELPLVQPPYARPLEIRFWIELLMILLQWYPPSFSLFWPTGAPPPRTGSLIVTFRQPPGHLLSALLQDPVHTAKGVWRPGLKQAFPGGSARKGQLPVRPDSPLRHLLLTLCPGYPGACRWYQPLG